MKEFIQILIIEDSEDDSELLQRLLKKNGLNFQCVIVEDWENLVSVFGSNEWDLVLSDYSLPGFNGMDALKFVREKNKDLPFIILSGDIGEEIAVDVMKAGANDYIMKDNMIRLFPALLRELREFEGRKNQREIKEKLREKEEQFRVTRLIQQSLFPTESINLDKYDIGGRSFPAEAAGGDYYDFISFDDQRVGIVIGDVTGHGIGPALLMTTTRAYIRAFSQKTLDSGKILEYANQILFSDMEEGKRFVTLFLSIFSPFDSSLIYSSAGHHNGYILDKNGGVKTELRSTGLPLGILPDSTYPCSNEIFLEPGDIVILLTDGISDAISTKNMDSNSIYGDIRVIKFIHEHRNLASQEIVDKLHESIMAYSDNYQEDDITAVVIKVT